MPKVHRCGELGCMLMVPAKYRYCEQHYKQHHEVYMNSRETKREDKAYQYHQARRNRHYDRTVRANTKTEGEQSISRSKFYRSKQWDNVRYNVTQRDGNECQICGAMKPRMYVDHVIPLRLCTPTQRISPANLWTLCGRCHKLKTDLENSMQDNNIKLMGTKNFFKKSVLEKRSK